MIFDISRHKCYLLIESHSTWKKLSAKTSEQSYLKILETGFEFGLQLFFNDNPLIDLFAERQKLVHKDGSPKFEVLLCRQRTIKSTKIL